MSATILQRFEAKQIAANMAKKTVPDFRPGDTIRVNVRITEGTNDRIQAFEGVCIARKKRGLGSSFVVRKISHGEGVERTFPLYSANIESIALLRKGDVRRGKLYYMRELRGKAARIRERISPTDGTARTPSTGEKVAAPENEMLTEQQTTSSAAPEKKKKEKKKKEASSKKA